MFPLIPFTPFLSILGSAGMKSSSSEESCRSLGSKVKIIKGEMSGKMGRISTISSSGLFEIYIDSMGDSTDDFIWLSGDEFEDILESSASITLSIDENNSNKISKYVRILKGKFAGLFGTVGAKQTDNSVSISVFVDRSKNDIRKTHLMPSSFEYISEKDFLRQKSKRKHNDLSLTTITSPNKKSFSFSSSHQLDNFEILPITPLLVDLKPSSLIVKFYKGSLVKCLDGIYANMIGIISSKKIKDEIFIKVRIGFRASSGTTYVNSYVPWMSIVNIDPSDIVDNVHHCSTVEKDAIACRSLLSAPKCLEILLWMSNYLFNDVINICSQQRAESILSDSLKDGSLSPVILNNSKKSSSNILVSNAVSPVCKKNFDVVRYSIVVALSGSYQGYLCQVSGEKRGRYKCIPLVKWNKNLSEGDILASIESLRGKITELSRISMRSIKSDDPEFFVVNLVEKDALRNAKSKFRFDDKLYVIDSDSTSNIAVNDVVRINAGLFTGCFGKVISRLDSSVFINIISSRDAVPLHHAFMSTISINSLVRCSLQDTVQSCATMSVGSSDIKSRSVSPVKRHGVNYASNSKILNGRELVEVDYSSDELDDEDQNSVDDDDESRNSLYWIDGIGGYPCIWFGHFQGMVGNKARVIPICFRYQIVDDKVVWYDSQCSLDKLHENYFSLVPRKSLIPLDNSVLKKYCKDSLMKDVLYALLDFAEWDDGLRDSYYWPSFILDMLRNPLQLNEWIHKCEKHSLFLCAPDAPRHKMFLFFLGLELIGMSQELCWDECLKKNFGSEDVLYLWNDMMTLERDKFESSEIIRYHSRVGVDYQVSNDQFEPCDASLLVPESVAAKDILLNCDSLNNELVAQYMDKCRQLYSHRNISGHFVQVVRNHMHKEMGKVELEENNSSRGNTNNNNQNNSISSSNKSNVGLSSKVLTLRSSDHSKHSLFCYVINDQFPDGDWLMVSDGLQRYFVRRNSCHIPFFPEDVALHCLNSNVSNFTLAFQIFESLLPTLSSETRQLKYWNESLFAAYIVLLHKYDDDSYKIYKKMKTNFNWSGSYQDFCFVFFQMNQRRGDFYALVIHDPWYSSLRATSKSKTLQNESNSMWMKSVDIKNKVTSKTHTSSSHSKSVVKPSVSHEIVSVTSSGSSLLASCRKVSNESQSMSCNDQSSNLCENGNDDNYSWPVSFPRSFHQIYWLRTSNCPVLCTGVTSNGYILGISICGHKYNHECSIRSSNIELFDRFSAQFITNRDVCFASALMDFCRWNLEGQYPGQIKTWADCFLYVNWYRYPPFILELISHPLIWSAWRRKAERNSNCLSDSDRRNCYFEGLKASYIENSISSDHNRNSGDCNVNGCQQSTNGENANVFDCCNNDNHYDIAICHIDSDNNDNLDNNINTTNRNSISDPDKTSSTFSSGMIDRHDTTSNEYSE